MPRQRSAPAFRQHAEPIVEPRGEALDAKRSDAGSRQFQRQRHAIEPATDLQDRWDIGIVEGEPVHDRSGPFVEQLNSRITQRLRDCHIDRLQRNFQGSETV